FSITEGPFKGQTIRVSDEAKRAMFASHTDETILTVLNKAAFCTAKGRKVLREFVAQHPLYTATQIATARALGAAALVNGTATAPAQDAALLALLVPNAPMGSSIPLLAAWNEGFHAANLAA
ncbi:MAG: hypothetical protein WCG26_10610, partial [Chloroflexales bacterium]